MRPHSFHPFQGPHVAGRDPPSIFDPDPDEPSPEEERLGVSPLYRTVQTGEPIYGAVTAPCYNIQVIKHVGYCHNMLL